MEAIVDEDESQQKKITLKGIGKGLKNRAQTKMQKYKGKNKNMAVGEEEEVKIGDQIQGETGQEEEDSES